MTITSNGSNSLRRTSQPLTPPHHSTTPKNLRPHHPHVYSTNTSPLVTANASPTLRRGVHSPLKKNTQGNPRETEAVTPSSSRTSPDGSMDPVAAKGGSSSLPRKRHRVQSGEAELAREEADRPLVGTPTPHKTASMGDKEGASARKREKSRVTVADDASKEEARLQLSAEDENPFMARSSGGFVVYEDAGGDAAMAGLEKQTAIEASGDEDKENIRLMPAPVQASTSTTTMTAASPASSLRPGAAPLQRATAADNRPPGRATARAPGKTSTSTSLATGSRSNGSKSSSDSSEEGSSFFASSSSSSASGAEGDSLGAASRAATAPPRLLSGASRRGGRDLPPARTLGRRAREGSHNAGSGGVGEGGGGASEQERERKAPRRKGTGGRLSLLASAGAEADADADA